MGRSSFDIEKITVAITKLFPGGAGLHEPWFLGREVELVTEAIRSTYVSTIGQFVTRFEGMVQEYTGSKYAVAVVNGTSALHTSLLLTGLRENEEVIIPGLTFIATANAVLYCKGVPHFADVSSKTLGIDSSKLEIYLNEIAEAKGGRCWNKRTGRVIHSIVPMHTLGIPVDLDPLIELAERWNLKVIEDAAESLGTYYKGKHTGTIGLIGVLSFNGNKVVTSGGGGMILTQDEDLAKRARHVTTTAKLAHPWEFIHDEMGYNYRMPNLNAALACAQMENLPLFLNNKRKLYLKYREIFSMIPGLQLVDEPEYGTSNFWLNAVRLEVPSRKVRDQIIQTCHEKKVFVRPLWTLMPDLKFLADLPSMDLGVARNLIDSVICLPSSPFLIGGER